MEDKPRVNFKIVLSGAILTIAILYFLTNGISLNYAKNHDYNLIKVAPYILVLVLVLSGVNVAIVLIGGISLAEIIGLIDGSFGWIGLLDVVSKSIISTENIAMIALLTGGLIGTIQRNGGIEQSLQLVRSKVKSKRGVELGVASLASVVDIVTANNTISIIMSGPLAKNIADEYNVDSGRSVSILDIFGGCFQGLLPYSLQVISATGVVGISPLVLFSYSIYPILLGICGLTVVLSNFPELKKNASQGMKH